MQKVLNQKTNFIFIIAGLVLIRLFFAFVIWHPDLNNHVDWGIRFFQYGPKMFYAPEANVWSYTWPNQPPGTTYMFAGVRILFEFVFNIFWKINILIPQFPSIIVSYFETNLYPALLKLPAILADFGIAYLVYRITNKKWAGIVWLLNPVSWYNSAVWGQYDAVINFLALLSFYFLLEKKLTFAVLAFALSIYVKASLLIFAPIFLIIALRQRYQIKEYAMALLTTFVLIGLVTLPFSRGNVFVWLYELYSKKIFVQQLHVITANAFNLWSGIAGIHERPDTLPFLGLNFKLWSYLLFAVSYLPLLLSIYKNQSKKNVIWVLALTAFSSFILLTNMHERYLYPLFPYFTILIFWYPKLIITYVLVSLINILNLYNFWFTPRIDPIVNLLSFGDRLMPRVLGFANFGLFLNVYRSYNEKA